MTDRETFLWRLSCAINVTLLGHPKEPLCSRIYRWRPSRFRSLYITVIDGTFKRVFNQDNHCLSIHADFVLLELKRRLGL